MIQVSTIRFLFQRPHLRNTGTIGAYMEDETGPYRMEQTPRSILDVENDIEELRSWLPHIAMAL